MDSLLLRAGDLVQKAFLFDGGINKLADMSSLVAAQANTLRNVANVAPKAHGYPALIDAAAGGSLEAVKRLAPLSEPDRLGEAFLAAAQHGRMDVARWLLPFFDPLANESQALREAARNGKVEMVEMLLPLSDPQAKNSQALRLALAEGELEVAFLLKNAIASMNRVAQSGPPDNSPTHPAIPEKLHSRREQNHANHVLAQGLATL